MPCPPRRLDAAEPLWVDDLVTIGALTSVGVRRETISDRLRAGRWTQPLPGVVSRLPGAGGWPLQVTSAVLYGGEGAVVSCASAAAFYRFGRTGWPVHIAVPHGRRLPPTARVVVHQTTRPMNERFVDGLLVAARARAAVDAAMECASLDQVCALLGRAVQVGQVTALDLADELDRAPRRGSRLARQGLVDITAGAHAASEARLVRLLARSGLPRPEYNAAVSTRLGPRFIDALWRELRRGVEIDGARVHADAGAWAADLKRQNAIQLDGVVLLRIAARRLWTEPETVLAEVTELLAS